MSNTKGTSVISNPQGGGAQSGLGEKFSPDLFTGTGNFSVPIVVPPGRNGFQPQLTLGYSSGNGNGMFGMGWALGIPGVMRKTSKGIPVYNDQEDIFILSGAEDLVPVKRTTELLTGNIGLEITTYRPRTEGLFARILRYKKTNGEHYWEVRSKDGLISWYGTPGATNGSDDAVVADPNNRKSIFSWALTKTIDPFGNEIVYSYERDLVTASSASATNPHQYDQIYLKEINYAQYMAGSTKKYMCKVAMVYEQRPDPHSTYKQGFEVRTTKRCVKLETYTNAASLLKTKTYHFKYKTTLPLNGASLLAQVSVEGHDGTASEFMPPLEFGYAAFNPLNRDLQEIKGPLPINSLAEPGFELVDVTGNGIPDVLQLNGVARYWPNKGNGQFALPKELNMAPSVQLGTPGVKLIDANGDGRNDLLIANGVQVGYYPGVFNKVWSNDSYVPYKQAPSFNLSDPEVQLMDLDGDGITDVLRNGAKFECFYNFPQKGFGKVKVVDKTFADFSFADPRIRFADMTGDGMQDIVLISSGRVQYWPNLGYGRFGRKINMSNAPVFPEQYNPEQVLLGDLDGDGQADIAFVENNKVTLYVNQSGNGFSAPVQIKNTPRIYNPKALRIADVLGTGQAGILWSFGPDAATAGKMYFMDLTKGNKPYVLDQMNNNMGSITQVKYGSSVYHYLRDEANPATRWQTQLPFPVQVVNKVTVIDLLSNGKLVTEYNYHNGYWDGFEREFRGFAQVDSKDTESFTEFNQPTTLEGFNTLQGLQTVTPQFYSPPVLTKSWFYVGPLGDSAARWVEPDFTAQYWSGDANVLTRPLATQLLLKSLPLRARRDALRTLRGTLLRSELYAIDGSLLQEKPYTVTETQMGLRMEFDPSLLPNPLWSETQGGYAAGGGYIFFPFNVAQRTSQYERGTDPMHNFSFTQSYDNYGQALGQLSIGLPRGATISGGTGDYLGTYGKTEFIYKDSGSGQYMVNRVKRSLAYDATHTAQGKALFNLVDDIFAGNLSLPVINCTLNYYDGAAFTGLAYGNIGNYGAQVRSETLVITGNIITQAYGANTPECFKTTPNWVTGYPAAFAGLLQNADARLGYKDFTSGSVNHVPGWYAESARVKYDFQGTGPMYGLVQQSRDVFENWSSIDYDVYNLLPIKSTQYLYPYGGAGGGLVTEADYDYRVMQPYRVKDVNDNYSVFNFTPLGLLNATALIGKGTEGDYRSNTGGFFNRYAPSVVMEYDFFAFVNNAQPVWVKTINRELHYQQSAVSPTITKVEYSDGFGRLLQTRVQAEDVLFTSSGLPAQQNLPNGNAVGIERGINDPFNVVVNGWKVYNNKGEIIVEYEPFFSSGFVYLDSEPNGTKYTVFYDALGRVVVKRDPQSSEYWTYFGIPNNLLNVISPNTIAGLNSFIPSPWISFYYDQNDLADVTNPLNNNVPIADYYTPKSKEIDAFSRLVKVIEHIDKTNNPPINNITTTHKYDIRDNVIETRDSYNRIVDFNIYELNNVSIYNNHIDRGVSTIIVDVEGKAIQSDDAKGARCLTAYELLKRPTHNWAKNKLTDSITLRNYIVYGEYSALPNPESKNLNFTIYKFYNESGLTQNNEFDFKNNLLEKIKFVFDYTLLKSYLVNYQNYIVDWTGLPNILDNKQFQINSSYDALNRIIELRLPEDQSLQRKIIEPKYSTSGELNKLYFDGNEFINHIAHNARGQRLLIAYNNDVMTRYSYDDVSTRLLRTKSEKYSYTQIGNIVTYSYNSGTTVQDDQYNFDLIGNILNVITNVNDCGINGTILGSNKLKRDFQYDSLYRLIKGNGRESDTQNGNNYLYDDAPIPGTPNANNVRAYDREYRYDKLGNVLQVKQGGVNGFTRNFIYNPLDNKLQRIEDSSGSLIEDFSYDNCGNQITAGASRHYSWNQSNQLISYYNQVGTSDPTIFTQYDYDDNNERASKLVRTGTAISPIFERTIYVDGIFEYVTLEDSSNIYEKNYIHLTDDKSKIVEVRINVGQPFPNDIVDDIVYILEDQIGSSVARLDKNGFVIDKEEYYPFGDSSLRTFTYKRYRYVGKERDAESGLYYYGARYYAAWTCRFISVDPIASDYPYYTPYNYAGNKPINKIDMEGLQEAEPDSGATNSVGGDEGQDQGQNTSGDRAEAHCPCGGDAADPDTSGNESNSIKSPSSDKQEKSPGIGGKTGKPSSSGGKSSTGTKSGGGGNGSSTGGGGGNGTSGVITGGSLNNTKQDTYEEYAYKTSQSAWKRGDYMMWFEYRLKAGLGSDFDRKSEKALKPFAEFAADINPLLGLVNFIYSLRDGKDIYGKEVTATDRVLLLLGMFGTGALKSIKWLKGLGKPVEGIVQNSISHWHHLIPKKIFTQILNKIAGLSVFKNMIYNLEKLPAGFHGNHPKYTDWIAHKLNEKIILSKSLDLEDLLEISIEAKKEIAKAYKIWLKHGKSKQYNLNEYFKKKMSNLHIN